MALIDCPSCSKKISDKAQTCQHCGFNFETINAEDLTRKKNLQMYLKNKNIQTQSMIAMLLFVAGFGFMYWGGTQPGELQHNLAVGLAIIGFIWYIVNRVRLIMLKRNT